MLPLNRTCLPTFLVLLAVVQTAVADDETEIRLGNAFKAASQPLPMDQLVKLYKEMGLPIPPANATLAVYVPTGTVISNGKRVEFRHFCFVIEPATDKRGPIVLSGSERFELDGGKLTPVREPIADVSGHSPISRSFPFWSRSPYLLLAIQCEIHGLHQTAADLLKQTSEPTAAELATAAWQNQLSRLIVPGSDRRAIYAQMAKLQAAYPWLDADSNYLESLKLTIDSPAPKGPLKPLEDQILALTEYSTFRPQPGPDYIWSERRGNDADASLETPMARISKDLLRALPALRAHLHDQRLTRRYAPPMMRYEGGVVTVGSVVRDFLEGLIDGRPRDLSDEQLCDKIMEIELEVEQTSEESYLASRTLAEAPTVTVNQRLLNVLAAKYPRKIIPLYQRAAALKAGGVSRALEEAMVKTSLPVEDLAKVFLAAEPGSDLGVKLSALWGLFHIKHAEFAPRLAAAIDELPATSTGSYWHSQESAFGYLVIRTADPKAWAATTRWADRADMGQRMEILNFMTRIGGLETNHDLRIAFCRRFLKDTRRRNLSDDPAKFDGPCAGFTYESLRVSDFAAMELVTLLKIDAQFPPAPDPGEQQWKNLQETVTAALVRYDAAKPR